MTALLRSAVERGVTLVTTMTPIAIQERLDGKAVDWLEQVSDEQYRG